MTKKILIIFGTRPEAIKLVGTDIKKITNSVNDLLNNTNEYQKMSLSHNPYGDGQACGRIVEILAK